MPSTGARHYLCTCGTLYAKRSSDPTSNSIVKFSRVKGSDVFTTGSVWLGPAGGSWAQLDTSRGEKEGWILIQGPGFAFDGPFLIEVSESPQRNYEETVRESPSVYALSDLHTDHPDNMALLDSIPAKLKDVVLLAGDISHDLQIVRKTFEIFLAKFKMVFFCPGNHDLWLQRGDGHAHSFEKLESIFALCNELGVITKPRAVGGGVLIVPLHSWYEAGFDREPNVEDETLAPVEDTMTDFALCKWPSGLSVSDGSVARHFDELNGELPDTSQYNTVISFSHFLPRPDLIPEKRYLFYPHLPKAVGSLALGERVRKLQPACHVFGHTHYGWSINLDGVHFLQPAVAYPRERISRGFALSLRGSSKNGFKDSSDASRENGIIAPILVYDAICKELIHYQGFWSTYYTKHPRRPDDINWIYRNPRNKLAVQSALRKLVDDGNSVEDEAIEKMLRIVAA